METITYVTRCSTHILHLLSLKVHLNFVSALENYSLSLEFSGDICQDVPREFDRKNLGGHLKDEYTKCD